MANIIQGILFDPYPIRTAAKKIVRKFRIGNYERRVSLGAVDRPNYGYCCYHAAVLARRLGHRRMSVLEFGVAGGNGLLNLEYHAQEIERALGVHIEVYGFDTGGGLPEPVDYRDLPYHWKGGFFSMDVDRLKARLRRAKLVLGDIKVTRKDFIDSFNPAPIGAMMYDVDLYSSTVSAMALLDTGEDHFLPRVFCYFDDIVGTETELYNEFTGELLAIKEFNESHATIKFCLPHHLLAQKVVEGWMHGIRICHLFSHRRYSEFVSEDDQQLPCG